MDPLAEKRPEGTGDVERLGVPQHLSWRYGRGASGNIIVSGDTNRQNAIDPPLRRPGRFDRELEIGVPDKLGRFEGLEIHTRSMRLGSDVHLHRLADIFRGYTGAAVSALCRQAAMKGLRPHVPDVNLDEGIPSNI